jgi:aminomethyltransferase
MTTDPVNAPDGTSPDALDDMPQRLPLDAWHEAHGARMVDFAGYRMPIQYEGIIAEHQWTRAHAGLFDVSHMGQLLLDGEGVDEALEALLPADVKGLKAGRMRYSLLLNDQGGILDDLMLSRREDGLYMVVNGATKWDDIAHLREHLPDAITLNHMEDRALLALQGPEAADALARVAPGVEQLSFMQAGWFLLAEVEAWISRSGYTGEDGFEISIPADQAERVADALLGQEEVRPVGLGARDSLRLEAGLPLYGHDLDPETTPIAADLGFALSKRRREEGGFPGHSIIMAERENGPALKRVALLVEGRQPVREGATVQGGGRVTSGGFSPTLGRPIAMAYVPVASTLPGSAVTLESRGKAVLATVTTFPFVLHTYYRKGA